MIYSLKEDIDKLKEFKHYVREGGYFGVWYVTHRTTLSDTAKNIIKSYGGDRLGWDDFENIIKILESIS